MPFAKPGGSNSPENPISSNNPRNSRFYALFQSDFTWAQVAQVGVRVGILGSREHPPPPVFRPAIAGNPNELTAVLPSGAAPRSGAKGFARIAPAPVSFAYFLRMGGRPRGALYVGHGVRRETPRRFATRLPTLPYFSKSIVFASPWQQSTVSRVNHSLESTTEAS